MSRKESSQQFEEIEKNIIKLIRIRGDKKGKVALNELAALYKSEFQCDLPFSPDTKHTLRRWLKQFKGKIKHRKGQLYIPQNNVAKEEKNILALLEQNKYRIKLNQVGVKYKSMFNAEMPIPEGMKIWDWLGKFKCVDILNSQNDNQTFIILRSSNELTIEEENVLEILEQNDGCMTITEMLEIFSRSHERKIVLPPGITLKGWLCSLNSVVLTKQPNKDDIFISLKHGIQCNFDRDVPENTLNENIGNEIMVTNEVNRSEGKNIERNNFEAPTTGTNTVTTTAKRKNYYNSKILVREKEQKGNKKEKKVEPPQSPNFKSESSFDSNDSNPSSGDEYSLGQEEDICVGGKAFAVRPHKRKRAPTLSKKNGGNNIKKESDADSMLSQSTSQVKVEPASEKSASKFTPKHVDEQSSDNQDKVFNQSRQKRDLDHQPEIKSCRRKLSMSVGNDGSVLDIAVSSTTQEKSPPATINNRDPQRQSNCEGKKQLAHTKVWDFSTRNGEENPKTCSSSSNESTNKSGSDKTGNALVDKSDNKSMSSNIGNSVEVNGKRSKSSFGTNNNSDLIDLT